MNKLQIIILSCICAPFLAAAQPAWLSDGLVAHYPLDGDARDVSGNGNHAALKGKSTFDEFGELLFDESEDRLHLPFPTNSEEITFSLFYTPTLYFEGVEDWLTVLTREGGEVNHLLFNKASMTFGVWNNRLTSSIERWDSYYPAGKFEWGAKMHFVVVIGEEYALYQNGQKLLSLPDYTSNQEFPVRHISGNTFNSQTAQGSIDAVRIYNRALSANEAEQLYVYEQTTATVPTPSVGLYLNSGKPADFSAIGDISYHDISYTYDAGGGSESAALFDGEQSYIEINNSNWGNRLNFTTSFWINLTSLVGGDHNILGNYARSSANGWGVKLNGDKLKSWYFGRSGNVWQGESGNVVTTLLPEQWYQVSSVYSDDGNSVYVNGDLVKHFPWASGIASTSTSLQNILIGKHTNADGTNPTYTPMALDNLFLYDVALTETQIGDLYDIQSKLFDDKIKKREPAILKNSIIGQYPLNGTLEASDPSNAPFQAFPDNTEDFLDTNVGSVLSLRNGNQFYLDIDNEAMAETGGIFSADLRMLGSPQGDYLKIISNGSESQTIELGLERSRRSDKIVLKMGGDPFFEHSTALRGWFNLSIWIKDTSFQLLLDGEHLFSGSMPKQFVTRDGLEILMADEQSSSSSGLAVKNFGIFRDTGATPYTFDSALQLPEADYGNESHHMFRCFYPEYFEWDKPPKSIGAEGKVYEFVTVNRIINWNEAELIAQSFSVAGHSCHLATINNKFESILVTEILGHIEENKGILEPFQSYDLPSEVWIGGHQTDNLNEPKGQWFWVNNEGPVNTSSSSGFSNWNAGEPNNALSNEDYMTLYSRRNDIAAAGKWNDARGKYTTTLLLEYEPSQTLEAGYVIELDPEVFSNLDSDQDGLTDNEEAELGTDPLSPDSDLDSLMDLEEITLGTNPLETDTDKDGLSDGFEAGALRYEYLTGGYTWIEAFELAESRNLHLATITSEQEQNLIISNFKNAVLEAQNTISPDAGFVWLGGTDIFSEGQWEWVTGEPFSYSNWFSTEPNNAVLGEEYILMYSGGDDEWNWNDFKNSPNDYPDISYEFVFGVLLEDHYPSNPLSPDTDADGYSDFEERANSTNPNIPTFQLQTIQQNGGVVSFNKDPTFYELNSTAIITAVPDAGYVFKRWAGALDSVENPLRLEVTESIALIPVFTEAKPPVINAQSVTSQLKEGQSQAFAIGYEGTAPIQISWTKDGNPFALTTKTLELTNVTPEDAGVYTMTVSNAYGTATLDAVFLTVVSPIRILSQSGITQLTEGESLNLGFTYSGTEPAQIQWFKDGVAISGANSNILLKSNAVVSDSGTYAFTVSNELGTTTSTPITVTVSEYVAPPVVTQFVISPNPALEGSSIIMSAAANGDGPLTFKWHKEDTLLASTDLPIYAIETAAGEDSGDYTVHVSNRAGTDVSDPIALSIVMPVSIEAQPEDALVPESTAFELSVDALGGGVVTYAWYLNDTLIEGASSATYAVPEAGFADTGQYHVVVSNGASTVKSSTASVLVIPFIEPPSILIQPNNKRVILGEASSMVVSAKGASPLFFQWKLNGESIFGAVQSFYLINEVSKEDAGSYTVTVSNEAGSIESNPATLSVIVPLAITEQSPDLAVVSGESFQLTVTLNTDTISESYWARDGERIPETSALRYEVPSASLQDAGSYTIHVTDGTDWVQSSPIMVEVHQPPVFKSLPEDRSVFEGQSIMLQWIAQGTGPLTYELLRDDAVIDSNHAGNFWVTASGTEATAQYVVRVSNRFGSVTSDAVSVSLIQSSPEIIQQPRKIRLVQGEALNLSIQASGGLLKYQWYLGASQIAGATGPAYGVAETQETDAGDYFVVVSNDKGIVTSKSIKVTFGARLSIQSNGTQLRFQVDPGTQKAQWKLQRSSNLLFWEDVRTLSDQDLEGVEMALGMDAYFYRVVAQ